MHKTQTSPHVITSRNWHSAKEPLCRVPGLQHSANIACLPSANGQHSAKDDGGATGVAWGILPRVILTLGKEDVCRVSLFAEYLALDKDGLCRVQHSANCLFAECPCFDTRQSAEHSAKSASPVVNGWWRQELGMMSWWLWSDAILHWKTERGRSARAWRWS